MAEQMKAEDALYGFLGWLTMLDEPITLGADEDASFPMQLLSEWMQANGLSHVSDNFPASIKHPKTGRHTPIDAEFICRYSEMPDQK